MNPKGALPMAGGRGECGYLNNSRTKCIDIDPERGPLVRKAFELYSTGEYTIKGLARHLKEAGLRSYRGNILTVSCVQRWIFNRR